MTDQNSVWSKEVVSVPDQTKSGSVGSQCQNIFLGLFEQFQKIVTGAEEENKQVCF